MATHGFQSLKGKVKLLGCRTKELQIHQKGEFQSLKGKVKPYGEQSH